MRSAPDKYSAIILILFVPAILLAAPAAGIAAAGDPASTFDEIAALRASGDYAAALERARAALDRVSAEGAGTSLERADLERLVETLGRIAALPDTAQAAMARADRRVAAYDSLHMDARFDEARAAAEEAIDIQTVYLGADHPDVGRSKARLAFATQNMGDLDGAEPVFAEALSILRGALGGSHPDIAEVLDWTGVMYLEAGEYEQSDRFLNEALEMYRRFSDASRGIAITLNDIGHLHFMRGEHADSENIYHETIEVWRRIGETNTARYATTLDNLGIVYATQGRYADAEPLYRESLALRREHLRWDHPDIAVGLNNLAGLYFVRGDYAEASPLYREALAIKRKTLPPGHPSLALGLSNLATVVHKQGDFAEAQALYEEALEIFKSNLGPDHIYVGLVLNNLATAILEQGSYARAESLETEALSIYRKNYGESHEGVATLLNNIANVKIERGDYAGAESYFRDALDIYERQFGAEHPSVAGALGNMSAMLSRQGRYTEAETALRRSLSIYENVLMADSPHAVTAMSLLGSVLFHSGDIDGAIETLESACEAFEVARRRVSVGGLKRTSYAASESPYPRLALAYLENGEPEKAWEAVERDHGRGLFDILQTRAVRNLTDAEIAEEGRLDKRLGRLEDAFVALANDTSGAGAEKTDSIRTVLLEAQSRWSRFQKDLADRYPIAEGRSYPLERIQSSLAANCALVGWLDVEETSFAYKVPNQGPVTWAKLPPAPIDSLARRYIERMTADPSDGDDLHRLGRELYAARLAPLESHLEDVDRIVVIPSGPMLGIPVEALGKPDGESVLDRWEVSYAPSATILAWLENKPEPGGDPSLFILGDPPFNEQQARAMASKTGGDEVASDRRRSARSRDAGSRVALAELKPLSGSRKEVTDIAALFATADVLLGEDASEANLIARAADDGYAGFQYIHLATHAIIDGRRAERSCLVLSQVNLPDPLETVIAGGRIVDGRLTVDEVLREWRLDARLVTLSACETALGREVRGEGYIGFAHAFFRAGTQSVVVSLWQVDDRATRRLMVRFYENMLERGKRRSAALREAKQWLRGLEGRGGTRPYSHPAYWSGFVLIGDPD